MAVFEVTEPSTAADPVTSSTPTFRRTNESLGRPTSIRAKQRDTVPTNSPILASSDAADNLEPAPLAPGWVLVGDPKPRMRVTSTSGDGTTVAGVWCCEPSRFTFVYDTDEFIHIISGRVTVVAGTNVHELVPGSTVLFPRGLTTQWTVHEAVHKVFVLRRPTTLRRTIRRLAMSFFRRWPVR